MPDSAATPSADLPVTAAAGPDLSGRTLGDYRLLRRLGRGGMAEVYLAEQGSLARQVAVKVLKKELAADPSYVRRFHQEARAAASFVHAHVVQIYEVGCVEGVHYIAQEYVQGANLRDYLARHGPPDLRLALRVLRQTASALHQAAQRGIVHRDIKPENIMLSRSGEVKVADFGLARLTRDANGVNLTQVGLTMGTPLYMSPEQVEGKPLDPRSDLYSLGVTCYHMLAGEPPFRGETALGVAVQHLKSQPPRLENVRTDLPPALCRIVHRLLEKDPAHRYGTALELLRDLRGIRVAGLEEDEQDWDDLVAEAAAATARFEATERLAAAMRTSAMQARPRRRRKLLVAAGLLVAFAVGGLAAWLKRPGDLMAGAAPGEGVQRLDSVELQWLLAETQGTEAAYLAVQRHYPEEEAYVRRADRELAKLYLRSDRLEESLALFRYLTTTAGELDEGDRAFGLAGQIVVLSMQQRPAEAAPLLADFAPLRDRLGDRELIQLVQWSIGSLRQQQRLRDDALWKSWLSEQVGDDATGDAS